MSDITWRNDTATLGELVPWERNPKRISKAHAKRLLEHWDEIGQFQTIAIGPNGEVYDGHQRLSVLLAAHGKRYAVDVRRSSRALTETEREKLVIAAHVGTTGQFDWDALSGWDADALQAWGMDGELLAAWNLDATNLREMMNSALPEVTPEKAWQGMPEFEQEDAFGAILTIKVHFASQEDIDAFASLVGQTVNSKTKFIWYPYLEKENLKAYKVVDSEP